MEAITATMPRSKFQHWLDKPMEITVGGFVRHNHTDFSGRVLAVTPTSVIVLRWVAEVGDIRDIWCLSDVMAY